jgi:hypothetical protein
MHKFIALEPLALGFGGDLVQSGAEVELTEARAAPLLARKAIVRASRMVRQLPGPVKPASMSAAMARETTEEDLADGTNHISN